jgi:hypothetical protein
MLKQKKMENQQFHTRGPNEEYMLSVNLNGRKKNTSVKHQIAKTNPDAQKCANYHSETTILNITNHQKN